MFYFLLPVLLTIYFEFLGRWIATKFKNISLKCYFPLGFFSLLFVTYLLNFLTVNSFSFNLVLVVYALLLAIGLFFIIRDFKKINFHFDWISIVFCILITVLLTYYSWNTTLGNLNGFDSTFYLNFVSENIGATKLNGFDIYLNGEKFTSLTYYSGQTYYYFASVIIYLYGKVASLFHIEYYYPQAFIWTFQILFNLSFSAILTETIGRVKKNIIAMIAVVIPLIFVFGKLYYNNVYGFFGNSYLTIILSYVSLFVVDYFEGDNNNLRYLIYILLLSSCAFSSSGIYSLLFVLFGVIFIANDKENLIKEYAFVMLIPLMNALSMERYSNLITVALPIAISVLICFVGPLVVRFINKHKMGIPALACCFLLTFGLSRFVSDGLFDFHGLLETSSQVYDMSLDYFNLSYDDTLIALYKILVLVLLFLNLIVNHKNRYIQFIWVLIIAFFNPFSCNILNDIVSVYYRSYAIFINPFTLIYFYEMLIDRIKLKYVGYFVSGILAIIFVMNIDFINPIYYHYQHEPDKDYNNLYKMNNDELDVIRELKSSVYYYGEENPYIVTSNLLTMSMLPEGKYLYARDNIESPYWSDAEKHLQKMFYLPEYLGDKLADNIDYKKMNDYVYKADINYIVVDKRMEYYDEDIDEYYLFMYKVSDSLGIYPYYENDTYVIYHIDD